MLPFLLCPKSKKPSDFDYMLSILTLSSAFELLLSYQWNDVSWAIVSRSKVAYSGDKITRRKVARDMVNDIADDKQNRGMLTVREASSLLHIHPNTLRWWSDQGILKAYRLGPRGDRRFKQEDISIFLLGKTEDVIGQKKLAGQTPTI